MADQALILCVDDEPANQAIMSRLLAGKYQVECVGSGQACLDIIEQRRPDLILLDLNMPDMDGLETCESLRKNPATTYIPVVFVTAMATEVELMAGYQAGGDDYITRPFSEDILQRKIEMVLEARARKQQQQEMTDSAMQVLARNQSNIGELDLVISFLHDCFMQTSFQGLSKVVFDCLGRLQHDSSLIFIVEPEPLYWSGDGIDRPMERQILLNLNSQDRIVKFGKRMAINSSKATILIRNMPVQVDQVARLTEHLTIIVEGLDARIKGIQLEEDMQRQRLVLDKCINLARIQLDDVKSADKKQSLKGHRIASKLSAEIEQLAAKMSLDGVRIKALQQIVNRFEDQSEKLNDERRLMHNRVELLISEIIDLLVDG